MQGLVRIMSEVFKYRFWIYFKFYGFFELKKVFGDFNNWYIEYFDFEDILFSLEK